MSKIIFRFSFLCAFIFLSNIATIRPSESMNTDTDDNLTLGQKIVREIKNAPGYEQKNYGRNTRKCRRVVTQPQPQLTPQQLEAQRVAAAQRAQQLQAQREAAEKARQEQQLDELRLTIKQFSESPQIPNDEFWQDIPKFLEETEPYSIFRTSFAFLTKDQKEDFAKSYIYEKKPSLVPLVEELECPASAPERIISIPPHQCLPFNKEFLFMPGLDFFNFKWETYGRKVDLASISVANASTLVYDLEKKKKEKKPLTKDEMLTRLNEGVDGFWSDVDCFEVITGNYGRYVKGKQPGWGVSEWEKQPAVVTWSNRNYPLILVAFKGTNKDKWADLTSSIGKAFGKDLLNLGKVHAGFCDIADSCRKKLNEKLYTICQQMDVSISGVKILFTGHSMGAAVAAISSIHQLATFASQSGKPLNNTINAKNNVVVINLGQPRIWEEKCINNFKNILGQNNLIRLITADKNGKTDPFSGYRPKDILRYEHFGHPIVKRGDDLEVSIRFPLLGGMEIHRIEYYKELFGK